MPGTRASNRLKQTQLDFNNTGANTPSTTRTPRSKQPEVPKTSPVTRGSARISLTTRARSSPIKPPNTSLFAARRNRRTTTVTSDEDDNEDDESEEEVVVRSARGKRQVVILSDSDDEESIRGLHISDPMLLGEAESTGDDMPTSSPAKRRGKAPQKNMVELSSSEEELPVKRRLRRKISLESKDESDGDDNGRLAQPKRRRKSLAQESDASDSPPRSLKRKRARKDDDLDEVRAELDDLRDSSPIATPVKPSQASKQKKIIEKIRRRKLRRQSGDNTISSDEDESDDYSYTDEVDKSSFQRIYTEGNLDEYEEDFLASDEEDDEGGTIGSPMLPFKFSRLATAPLEELFSYAVEWLIQNKVNPGFDRHSDLYDTVWKRLNDEMTGLAESKFKSASWSRDFVVSLEARPEMQADNVRAHELETNCEACGRTNHRATYRLHLMGAPYDPDSLEAIEQDEEAETEVDKRGRPVPADRIWYLGKTCFDNAESAHILAHWKRSLNLEVLDLLQQFGAFEPKAIVERHDQSVAKKGQWSKDLVNRWDDEGHIKLLWGTYRSFSETARENKVREHDTVTLDCTDFSRKVHLCTESGGLTTINLYK